MHILTRVTDALSHQTNSEYDMLHRLTKVTDALGSETTYAYDATGNRLTTTNALGKTWTNTYDRLGRVKTSSDPLGNTTTSTYDAAGALTGVAKPNGATVTNTYDRVYRRTGLSATMTPASGNVSVTWAYDAAGRRTSMTDATGTTTYSYDTADRLTSQTAPTTGTVGYAYDTANRLLTLTYPVTGHQVTYQYNARGLLWQVTDWQSKVTEYTYDSAGRLATEQLPNGQPASTRAYDAAGRLVSQTHTLVIAGRGTGTVTLGLGYSYDNANQLVTSSDTEGTPPGTTTYAYDTANRLTSETLPNAAVTSYTYDAVGNRLTTTAGGTTTNYTSNDAGWMTAAGGTTYAYDNDGNRTSATAGGATTTYTYDALDRMIALPGASYTYNGAGQRVRKVVGMVTTTYAYGGTPAGSQVLSDGTNEMVWGRGLIAEVPITSGAGRYTQRDGQGSVRAQTDASGGTTGSGQYDAFGVPRGQTGTQSTYGFRGQQTDAESGLTYAHGRYYEPSTGRSLSSSSDEGTVPPETGGTPPKAPICDVICKVPTQQLLDSGCAAECVQAYSAVVNFLYRVEQIRRSMNASKPTNPATPAKKPSPYELKIGTSDIALVMQEQALPDDPADVICVTDTGDGGCITDQNIMIGPGWVWDACSAGSFSACLIVKDHPGVFGILSATDLLVYAVATLRAAFEEVWAWHMDNCEAQLLGAAGGIIGF